MNCPKCGLQTLPDQRFCRSCGTNVQITTRPLTEHSTVTDLGVAPRIERKVPKQLANLLRRSGFLVMFIGLVIGVIGRMLMHDDTVATVGVLVSIAGMFFIAYPYLSPSPRQEQDSGPASKRELDIQSHPKQYFPRETNTEYGSSITERTTDLLKSPAASRPGQNEDRD